MHRLVAAGLLVAGAAAAAELERWLEFVVPSAAERAWQDIGWRPDLWDAVVAAHAEKRPILLWTMNGHPLAAT